MNNSSFVLASALLLLTSTVGCKREAPESRGPAVSSSSAGVSTTTPTPRAAPPQSPLPPPTFAELPGWLGVAAVPKGAKPTLWWTPEHPSAEAVLFTEAWKSVPVGTRVLGLSVDGPMQLEFAGQSTERYGCEENTQSMAAFNAPRPLPEGPVWILPSQQATGAASYPIQSEPVAKNATKRTWKVAGIELTARKTGPLKGVLEVKEGGKVVAHLDFAKGEMAGADKKPIDLSSNDEIGLPVPVAAFVLGEQAPMAIVLSVRGYEGQTFRVVMRPRGATSRVLEGSEGLYYCAF